MTFDPFVVFDRYETTKRVYVNDVFLAGREGDEDYATETVTVEARKGRAGETVNIRWDDERVMRRSIEKGSVPPIHITTTLLRGEYVCRPVGDDSNAWIEPGCVFRLRYRKEA